MKQLRYTWFIALKDLKIFATDRGALLFFLLFPFLFITLFSLISGDSNDPRIELHLVTREAEGGLSYQIIEAMETKDEAKLNPGDPKIIWDKDYDKARQAVENEDISGFLAFPSDFTEGIMMGYGTQLEIVADAENINTRAALNGLAQSISAQVGTQQVVNNAVIGLLVKQGLASESELSNIGLTIQQLFSGKESTIFKKSYIEFNTEIIGEVEAANTADWTLPGYLV
ncbi:MAG: ABC transporter permease, partial [Dehalococcoidales bacterium]|nr:ABC transporter permease [Dehalococcoidales bacterium]